MHRSNHRVLCTISGIDPTGGAGQAVDLAVFRAFGARGTAVVTAETAQDARGVQAVHPRPGAEVGADLARVLAEDEPAALKTGMLATAAIVAALAEALAGAAPCPLVVDPVLAAGAGGALLEPEAVGGLAGHLAPHATLLTPNLPEAAHLLGLERLEDPEAAARALLGAGWAAVLLKGGHAEGPEVVDLLATPSGVTRFVHPRSSGGNVRGTGCALASAIAALLGLGHPLEKSVQIASDWLWTRIAAAHAAGRSTLGLTGGTLSSDGA